MDHKSKKQKSRRGITFVVFGFLIALFAFLPLTSFAQLTIDQGIASTFGLGSADLEATIINIVQWALGLIGLVAVIMIMYGGFIWITAAGNVDKVQKAKRIVTQAAIGLVIVLLAWAIVQFIVGAVTTATGGPGYCTTGQQIGYPSCSICDASNNWVPDAAPSDPACYSIPPSYYVRWTIPEDSPPATDVSLCSIVAAGFDGVTPPWLDGTTVDSSTVTVTPFSTGTNVTVDPDFTVNPNSNAFRYKHASEWLPNELYTVQVSNGVRSTYPLLPPPGGVSATSYSWNFTTGTTSDADPPQVTTVEPTGPGQCLQPTLKVTFNEPMDPISVNKNNVTLSPNHAAVESVFASSSNVFLLKLDGVLQGNTTYTVTLNADITNGIWDTCGNALDCGNGLNVCTADGTADGTPLDDYSWTFTTEDTTEVDCAPSITSVSSIGNYSNNQADAISITGTQLHTVDSVFFKNKYFGNDIQADDQAGAASKCFNTDYKSLQSAPVSTACIASATSGQVDVVVPAGGNLFGAPGNGATDGSIRVRSVTEFSNVNNDLVDVGSPQIKTLSPSVGGEGQLVTISGDNFTANGAVWLRRDDGTDIQALTCDPTSWSNNQIVIKIPAGFNPGDNLTIQIDTDTAAANDGRDRSNARTFVLTNDDPTPGICSIIPVSACHDTASNNLTLNGEGFGGTANLTYFAATGANAPTIWSSSTFGVWDDTQVQVTTPNNLPNDTFNVFLETSDGRLSNSIAYSIPCGAGPDLIYNGGICDTSASLIPSPNPYPDKQDVCPNLDRIAFEFTENVVRPVSAERTLSRCNSGRATCDSDFTDIPASSTIGANPDINFSISGFTDTLAAAGNSLQADTWYKFSLSGSVHSSTTSITLGADEVWYFKTRTDPTPCDADAISIDYIASTGIFDSTTNVSDGNNAITYDAILTNDATCNVIIPPTSSFVWGVDNPAIAICNGGCVTQTAQILTDSVNEGTAQIQATYLATLSTTRPITVKQNFCDVGTPCVTTDSLSNICTSTCDPVEQRCVPHLNSTNPASGAPGSGTTLNGCFFGVNPGRVIFDDGVTTLDGDINICGPIAQWNDKEIIVGIPAFPPATITDISVEANYSGVPLASDNTQLFTYTNTCSNGAAIPPGGVPVLCSISPNAGGIGDVVTFRGANFFIGRDVQFNGATTNVADNNWIEPIQVQTRVPSGFSTGLAFVEIQSGTNVCPSNGVVFGKTCTQNSNCATGCCVSNACVSAGSCSTGTIIGEACQISNAFYAADTTCNVGPTAPMTIQGDEYRCLSDTGYNEDPGKTALVTPSGTECSYCCDPDEDGDGDSTDSPGGAQVSASGLTCVQVPAGGGVCETALASTTGAGLFCGCDPTQETTQCGVANGCSTQNDPTGQQCCRPRPTVQFVGKNGGGDIQCLNEVIVIDFDHTMDKNSINAGTIQIRQGGVPVSGTFSVSGDKAYFAPSGEWNSWDVEVTILGDPSSAPFVKDLYGVTLGADYVLTPGINIMSGASLCNIDNLFIQWSNASGSHNSTSSLYTCSGDRCISDIDPAPGGVAGNQQNWMAIAMDSDHNWVTADVTYLEDDPDDVFELDPTCSTASIINSCDIISTGNAGHGVLQITADGTAVSSGIVQKNAVINASMCDVPWPPKSGPYPYEDSDYNFGLSYCREGLPTLWIGSNTQDLVGGVPQPGPFSPLIQSYSPSDPNVDELFREYIFFVTDDAGIRIGSDAVGIRVMENSLHLPPDLWYERTIGRSPYGAVETTVNGFPAMRLGRSVYIAASNLVPTAASSVCGGPSTPCNGGVMYNNMYILSYDGDSPVTDQIFSKLIQGIQLTYNVGLLGGTTLDDNAKIRNDVARVQDIFRMTLLLSDYKKLQGEYPTLDAGTYLQNSSMSKWPSWQETLGSVLGSTLPTDPINEIVSCPYGPGNEGCWDESARTHEAPDGSHLYHYVYPPGNQPFIFTRFEYTARGNWLLVGFPYDPCSSYAGSACPTYNYFTNSGDFEANITLFQTVGVSDTTAPVINTYAIPPNITAPVLINISSTDTESGNARAEFYINGALRYIDYTNDFEWQFNPYSDADGTYDFNIKVYDNAGNMSETGIQVVVIQTGVSDQEPPSVSNFTPLDSAVLLGATWLNVTATDSGSGIERVEYFVGIDFIGSCLSVDACAASNYGVLWDTTTETDGMYDLYAVAYDNASNTAIIKHVITTNNGVDLEDPFVTITSHVDFDVVSGTILVAAQASDNQGVAAVELFANLITVPGTASFPNPDTVSPFRWSVNTTAYPDGSTLTFNATVTDVNGNASSDSVDVIIDNSAGPVPTAWFDLPSDGDVYQPGIFQVHAEALNGVDYVELHAIDGGGIDTLLGTTTVGNPYQFSWNGSLSDGQYTIRAIVIDQFGQSSNVTDPNANLNLIIDTTPPTITSWSPVTGSVLTGTVNVTVDASDANGLFRSGLYSLHSGTVVGECYPSGAPSIYTCNTTWDTTIGVQGINSIIPFAIDIAGNTGSLYVDNVETANSTATDTSPPILNVSVLNNQLVGGTQYISGSTQIEYTGTDNVAITEVTSQMLGIDIDSAGQEGFPTCTSVPCTVPWNTIQDPRGIAITDGTSVTIAGIASDAAGNVGNATDTVLVDNSPPSVSSIADDGATTNDASQLYATWGTANEPHIASPNDVEYFYSIGTFSGDTSTVGWTSAGLGTTFVYHTGLSLTDGTTYFTNMYAVNGAGLQGNTISTDGILYSATAPDTTPPTNPVITTNPNNIYNSGTIDITVTSGDFESGIQLIDILIDGVSVATCNASPCSYPWDTTTEVDGGHTISAIATNNVGLFSNTTSVAKVIDNTAPTVAVSIPFLNQNIGGASFAMAATVTGTTPAAIVQMDMYHTSTSPGNLLCSDTSSSGGWSCAVNLTSFSDGPLNIIAEARDSAGNVGVSSALPVNINNSSVAQNCGTNICGVSSACCNVGSSACYNTTTQYCCSGSVQSTSCGPVYDCNLCTGSPKDPSWCSARCSISSGGGSV